MIQAFKLNFSPKGARFLSFYLYLKLHLHGNKVNLKTSMLCL